MTLSKNVSVIHPKNLPCFQNVGSSARCTKPPIRKLKFLNILGIAWSIYFHY